MWAHGGLLARYLSAVSEILDRLAREREIPLAPATSISILFFLSSLAAFTSPLPLRPGSLLPFYLAFVLAVLGREFRTFLKTVGLTITWLTVVSLPLLFTTPGRAIYALEIGSLALRITWEGVLKAVEFSIRCLNAISLGVAWTSYVGLNNILRGLRLLDPTGALPEMVFLTARYVPLSLREASRLLAAREARLIGRKGLRSAWLVLASCCGELLLRSYHRALRVSMAIRSRCLSGQLISGGVLTRSRASSACRDQPPWPRSGHAIKASALDALWVLVAGTVAVLYLTRVV